LAVSGFLERRGKKKADDALKGSIRKTEMVKRMEDRQGGREDQVRNQNTGHHKARESADGTYTWGIENSKKKVFEKE